MTKARDRKDILAAYDPDDVDFVRQQLEVNLDTGDPAALLGMRAFGADGETVEAVVDIGAQMLRQGMPKQAFEYLTGLAQYEPLNPKVHRLLAIAEHQRKHYKLAIVLYRLALSIDADDGLSHLYLGECLLHTEQKQEGLAEVRKAIELLRQEPQLKGFVQRGEKVLSIQEGKK